METNNNRQQSSYNFNPQQVNIEYPDICFNSQFDSGNLYKVQQTSVNSYDLYLANDNQETEFERQYKCWFYFRVNKVQQNRIISFTIKNMNEHSKVFLEGMCPVYRHEKNIWNYINKINCYPRKSLIDNGVELTIQHTFTSENTKEYIYFAFTFPWTYQQNQNFMEAIENLYNGDDDIYFQRKLLTYTIERRRVELLTITSKKLMAKESKLSVQSGHKNYVFFSARVHPGEVPSSHVMNGLIQFLLDKNDPQSQILRENFIFLIVPMINPDGVYRGHWRVDKLGYNLNRCYDNPQNDHPQIQEIMKLLQNFKKRLILYMDMHAQSSKKGVGVYGNHMDFQPAVQNRVFCKLIALNNEDFDYDSCSFSEKNMSSNKPEGQGREGSGRVAVFLSTNLIHCYTLECNYFGGNKRNILVNKCSSPAKVITQTEIQKNPRKFCKSFFIQTYNKLEQYNNIVVYDYNIITFNQMGKSILISLLDYSNLNAIQTRLPNTIYKNIHNLRYKMACDLAQQKPYKLDPFFKIIIKGFQSQKSESQIDAIQFLFHYLEYNQKLVVQDQENNNIVIAQQPDKRSKSTDVSAAKILKFQTSRPLIKSNFDEYKFLENSSKKSDNYGNVKVENLIKNGSNKKINKENKSQVKIKK